MELRKENKKLNKQKLTPERFIELLGGFPNNSDLNIKVLKEEEFENYIRKTIEYTIVAEERHKAYLLIPKSENKKMAAILAIHKDSGKNGYKYGKSEICTENLGDEDQKYGIELVKRGYVVIAPDRFPFESRRRPYKKVCKKDQIKTRVYDYYDDKELDLTEDLYRGYIYNKILLQGYTPLGKELYEMKRAIDVLCSLEKVDKNKIGVIGHGIGGILSIFTMYIDKRIKAGCFSNAGKLISEVINKEKFKPLSGIGNLFIVPRFINYGDMDDVLEGIVPRPILEVRSDENSNRDEVEKIYHKAKEAYMNERIPHKLNVLIYNGKGEFREDMRKKCYFWLDKWL